MHTIQKIFYILQTIQTQTFYTFTFFNKFYHSHDLLSKQVRERIYVTIQLQSKYKIYKFIHYHKRYLYTGKISMKVEEKSVGKMVVYQQYQIQYEKIGDSQVNIIVCNSETKDKYQIKNWGLKNINFKGFEAALNESQKDFSYSVKEVEEVKEKDEKQEQKSQKKDKDKNKNKFVQLVINFSSFLVSNVKQVILIPFKCKISLSAIYKSNMIKIQQKIQQIQKKRISTKLVVRTEDMLQMKSNIDPNNYYGGDQGSDAEYDMKRFIQIELPQFCKYLIQFSMNLSVKQTYFYFYSNQNYQSPLSNGCMMLPVNDKFVPVKISFVVDNAALKLKNHVFYTYDVMDYPFKCSNIVITALKME